MFPIEKLTSGMMNSLLFYVSVIGLLLFIAVILRTKVKLFKKLFIPASLIAGLLGLILGQYGLKIFPADMMASFATLPGRLISVVFAPMLIGVVLPKPKQVAKMVGPQLIFGYIGDFIQIAVPFLVVALILGPLLGVNEMLASIVEIGFCGGHGTAGGMIEVFNELGWTDGGPLALTSATVGLFAGIVAGMIIINYGVRKGYTTFLKTDDTVDNESEDIIPKNKQVKGSSITINKDIVEGFAFHMSLIGIAILIGWIILFYLKRLTGLKLPLFPMTMIGGLIVQLIISKTKYKDAVDVQTLSRIQGLALEILIVAAVATIKVPVIVQYALPLSVLMIVSVLALVFYFFYFGPRMFKNQWFENAIVNFGMLAGVTAVGLMLLRTVDPDMKSDAGKAFALRAPFFSPFVGGGLLTSILPLLANNYGTLKIGIIFMALILLLLGAAKILGFWNKPLHKAEKSL